jgi:hypothetical protein
MILKWIPGMRGWTVICKSTSLIPHIHRMKDKNYILVGAEKALYKYTFMTKSLNKLYIEFTSTK